MMKRVVCVGTMNKLKGMQLPMFSCFALLCAAALLFILVAFPLLHGSLGVLS